MRISDWSSDVCSSDLGCAALEAARSGGRVVLLERAAIHGGTSSMSGGAFYLGGGTPVQTATGHEDSVEAMVDYLTAVSRDRSEERRVGKACVSTCRSRWSPYL